MVAEPLASADTSPDALTVAMAVSELVQVMVRSVSAVPFASAAVAVSWSVEPTTIALDDPVTDTAATGVATGPLGVEASLPPQAASNTRASAHARGERRDVTDKGFLGIEK